MNAAELPLAIVTGVGPGTGAALVRRFATGGYRDRSPPICPVFTNRFWWRTATTTRWCPPATRSTWRAAFQILSSCSMTTQVTLAFSNTTRNL
jgi:hypothetical protein